MKDSNYQDKYNMDRDLIWEAYGVVYEQPHAETEEVGNPDHPVLRQARSAFQDGVGNTPEAAAAQAAALEQAQATLAQDMERIKQEMRIQDKGAARGSAAPQQEQMQDTWAKSVKAYTELRQMAQAVDQVNQQNQYGIDMSNLLESFDLLGNVILEFNNQYDLLPEVAAAIGAALRTAAPKIATAAAEAGAVTAASNLANKATSGDDDEELEEGHNCDKDHPDEDHDKWEKKNVKQENCGDVPMPDADLDPSHDISELDLSDLEIDRISDGDTEGRMAKKDLYKLAKYSAQLHNMIEDGEELEGWVQAKVSKAADYIGAVFHYMDYDEERDEDAEHGRVELSDLEDIL